MYRTLSQDIAVAMMQQCVTKSMFNELTNSWVLSCLLFIIGSVHVDVSVVFFVVVVTQRKCCRRRRGGGEWIGGYCGFAVIWKSSNTKDRSARALVFEHSNASARTDWILQHTFDWQQRNSTHPKDSANSSISSSLDMVGRSFSSSSSKMLMKWKQTTQV